MATPAAVEMGSSKTANVLGGSTTGQGLGKGTSVQDRTIGVPIVSSFIICGIPSVHSLDFDELFVCGSAEATEDL